MSNCISCPTSPAPCACSSDQTCVQQPRSCSSCAVNVCLSSSSSSSGGGGSGSSLGATLGGSLGGVFAGLLIIGAVGWYYIRKKRGRRIKLEKEREERRLEKMEKKNDSKRQTAKFINGLPREFTPKELDTVQEEEEPEEENDKLPTPKLGAGLLASLVNPSQQSLSSSLEVNNHGGHRRNQTSSTDPFDDSNKVGPKGKRISVNSDDNEDTYTIRSSQSTSIIPIAYIPAHSASPAISDLQNTGGLGENIATLNQNSNSSKRVSFPQSLARTSVGSSLNIDHLDLPTPPPPLTSPVLGQMTVNGVPIRPPRAPGLDLKLPNVKKTEGTTGATRPPAAPTVNGRLSPVAPNTSGNSLSPVKSSHLSIMSTTSSLDDDAASRISYMLDPPKIVTPSSVTHQVVGIKKAVRVGVSNSATPTLTRVPSVKTAGVDSKTSSTVISIAPESPGGSKGLGVIKEDPFSDSQSVDNASKKKTDSRHLPKESFGQPPNATSEMDNPFLDRNASASPSGSSNRFSADSDVTGRESERESQVTIDIPSEEGGTSSSPGWLTSNGNGSAATMKQQQKRSMKKASARRDSEDSMMTGESIWTSTTNGGGGRDSIDEDDEEGRRTPTGSKGRPITGDSFLSGSSRPLTGSSFLTTDMGSQRGSEVPSLPSAHGDHYHNRGVSMASSLASSTADIGMLDGIPFVPTSASASTTLHPMSSRDSSWSQTSGSELHSGKYASVIAGPPTTADSHNLPSPYRPFAASSNMRESGYSMGSAVSRVTSAALSVSDFPFQLGGSPKDRGSVGSEVSMMTSGLGARSTLFGGNEDLNIPLPPMPTTSFPISPSPLNPNAGYLSPIPEGSIVAESEPTTPVTAKSTTSTTTDAGNTSNGSEQQIDRASVDTLALSAELAAQFENMM